MADLDVALRLRLINGIKPEAREAKKDLDGLKSSALALNGVRGGASLAQDLGRVATTAGRAGAGLRQMAAERTGLAAAGTATARLGTSLTAVATSADRVRTGLRAVSTERAGITATGTATARLGTGLSGLSQQAGQAAGGLARVGSQRAAIAGTAAVAAELARNLDRAASAAQRVRVPQRPRTSAPAEDRPAPNRPARTVARDGIDANLAMAGRGAVGGLVGGGVAVDSYRRAAAFDRRMTMIGQTADASREQIDALGARVHDLAQETAIPVDKTAGGLEALVAQGRTLKEALDFLPSVARTAAATGSEVEDIAKSADSVGSNFKIAAKEMQAAFDIMAAGGKAGQFELKDMARYLPTITPAAKAAGFEGARGLADVVSMLQVIRKGTGTAEEAATAMRNIFSKLESKETIKNFKEMGVDLEAAMDKGRKSGRNLVEVLEEATQAATKGDLSRIPRLFGDEQVQTGMRALATYRGEWQKLSGTIQGTSAGTVMRDLVQVTKDAQASIDRMSNSWNRFIQAASRAADAGGVSKGLGDTAQEFQSIAAALERVNEAYAKGGLTGALKQAAGDASDRIRENRKAWLDHRGQQEDGRIAELEADKNAHLEKLKREGYSAESIADARRDRDAEIEKARRRKGAVEKARQNPALADRVPLRMGVDPTAPIQGKPGPVGIGTVEFNKAFPIELRPKTTAPRPVPLPPQRPADVPRHRGIENLDEVLGSGARGASPALEEAARALATKRPIAATTVRPERFDPDVRGAVRTEMSVGLEALAGRLRAAPAAVPTPAVPPVAAERPAPAAVPPVRPEPRQPVAPRFTLMGPAPAPVPATGLRGPAAFGDMPAPRFDPQPLLSGMREAEEGAKRLRTGLSQDLSEPARQSMATFTAALTAGVTQAVAATEAAAARMKASLSFNASPTITPRLAAPSAAPAVGAAPASAPARAASPAPRVQSAGLRRSGGVNITGPVHVHGVSDVASLHRGIQREADRKARDSRDNGLHDLGAFA